ncbi:hypothetical protein V6N13_013732 [Hibiscus sabdariffa]|uniref:Uncharacterized protein n=2 Tax=Hibiscus sabdariffa TaxID=183260 RepID=A0ABR2BWJ1_9ROSI
MAYRTLEINVISAKGLKNVNLFDKMDVFCIVSLKGGPAKEKVRTPVDKDCGKNPNWNFPVTFAIDESLAQKNKLNVKFKIVCERILGDKELGKVRVPVKELLDSPGEGGSMKFVNFQVQKPSGRTEGSLDFSYRFGDAVAAPVEPEKNKGGDDIHQPVAAYPPGHLAAGSSSGDPYGVPGGYPPPSQAGYGYPPPLPHVSDGYGGYPPQGVPPPGYGYAPPQPGYGYAPPQPRYGYPPPQPGYGYPPVQQPPQKSSNFGLGLGAGLVGGAVGGMLIGDMISDAADSD